MNQILILVLGGVAIWLVGRKESWGRWGFVVGLISQPFWICETLKARQWGMFLFSLWCTYSWAQGIYNNFNKKKGIK